MNLMDELDDPIEVCKSCLRQVASEQDWNDIPEGEGVHLCWEPKICQVQPQDVGGPDAAYEVASLRARLAAAEKVIGDLEWRGAPAGGERTCPMCFHQESAGHDTGCALAEHDKETA